MIDYKDKNTPQLASELEKHGYRIGMSMSGPCGMSADNRTTPEIQAAVQKIIDEFDPISAKKGAALSEVDELAIIGYWRPKAQDLRRLHDTEQYIAAGRPETIADGQYRWLVSAADTQDMSITAMADYIIAKHDEAFNTETARLTVKKQIRAAVTVADVESLLRDYRAQ